MAQFGDDPFENMENLMEYLGDDVEADGNGSVLDDSMWINENYCHHIRGPALSGRVAESREQYAGDVASSLILHEWDCVENVFAKLDGTCCTGCVVARYSVGQFKDFVLCLGVVVRTENVGSVVVVSGYHDLSLHSRGTRNGCWKKCCSEFYRWLNSTTMTETMSWDFGRLPPYVLKRGEPKLGTKPWCRR